MTLTTTGLGLRPAEFREKDRARSLKKPTLRNRLLRSVGPGRALRPACLRRPVVRSPVTWPRDGNQPDGDGKTTINRRRSVPCPLILL